MFVSIDQAQPTYSKGSGRKTAGYSQASYSPLPAWHQAWLPDDRKRKVYFLCLPQITHRGEMIKLPIQPFKEHLTQNRVLTRVGQANVDSDSHLWKQLFRDLPLPKLYSVRTGWSHALEKNGCRRVRVLR